MARRQSLVKTQRRSCFSYLIFVSKPKANWCFDIKASKVDDVSKWTFLLRAEFPLLRRQCMDCHFRTEIVSKEFHWWHSSPGICEAGFFKTATAYRFSLITGLSNRTIWFKDLCHHQNSESLGGLPSTKQSQRIFGSTLLDFRRK